MKLLFPLVLLLASAASVAQPITVSNISFNNAATFQGGTAGTYQPNTSATSAIAGASYSFNLRGDVTAQFTGTATTFLYQAYTYFTLTTGPAPVRLTDITIHYNGKEVPSGGSAATYTATQFYRANLFAPGFGTDASYSTFLPGRTTQGVYIVDESHALDSTILAANTAYQLYMDVFPQMQITAYPPYSSMLGYAAEFGGNVSPQFDGLRLSFTATAVPEPGMLGLFGAGVVLLALRRRSRA